MNIENLLAFYYLSYNFLWGIWQVVIPFEDIDMVQSLLLFFPSALNISVKSNLHVLQLFSFFLRFKLVNMHWSILR